MALIKLLPQNLDRDSYSKLKELRKLCIFSYFTLSCGLRYS